MTALASTPYGVWLGTGALPDDPAALRELAAGIEELGFSALWLGGSWGADLSTPAELLAGSSSLVVGTSIANIWRDPAEALAASYAEVAATHGDRFVLGVGPGHHVQTQFNQGRYAKPLTRLREYLEALDAAQPPVPVERRAVSALGPKALELARDRTAGALPYLTTPEHTRQARGIVGADTFLAPEQKVVLSADPAQARSLARGALEHYLELPNYVNAWRRLGFAESDFEAGGSDDLIDALFSWGEDPLVKVRGHLEAGADHVCVQPIVEKGAAPLDALRIIAAALL